MCWCYSKGSTRTRNKGNEWDNEPGARSIGRGQGLWQSEVRADTERKIQKTQEAHVSCWHLNVLCHLRCLHALPNLQRLYCITHGSGCWPSVNVSCTQGYIRHAHVSAAESDPRCVECPLHSLNYCCLLQVPSRQQCCLQGWSSTTGVPGFKTPSHSNFYWAGLLILRVGRIFRWIWTDWNSLSRERVE